MPAVGVYTCDVIFAGERHRGFASIGYNDTFNGTEKTVEVHIFDFNGEIYGEKLTVLWLDKIRDMIKFDGIDQLIKQMKEDEQIAQRDRQGAAQMAAEASARSLPDVAHAFGQGKRIEDIVFHPGAKRHMPAPPEFRDGPGEIRAPEILRHIDAHRLCAASGDIDAADIERAASASCRQLRRQIVPSADRPLDDLREERHEQRHLERITLRLGLFPVHIDHIGHRLKGVKGNAQRQDQMKAGDACLQRKRFQQLIEILTEKPEILQYGQDAEIQDEHADEHAFLPPLQALAHMLQLLTAAITCAQLPRSIMQPLDIQRACPCARSAQQHEDEEFGARIQIEEPAGS